MDIALVLLTFVERMAAGASMARSLPSIRLLRLAVSAVAVWMLGQSHPPHRTHAWGRNFRSLVSNSFAGVVATICVTISGEVAVPDSSLQAHAQVERAGGTVERHWQGCEEWAKR